MGTSAQEQFLSQPERLPLPRALRQAAAHKATNTVVLIWLSLSVVAVLPIFLVQWLPTYDYHNWLLQGRLVADLLSVGPDSASAAQANYSLGWAPTPNLAAPLGIAALTVVFSPDLAGRLFLAFATLLFAAGYAYLVRSVQQRPTILEFFGFPWAFGYFYYKGYVSYLISLPLAFLAIGMLHRISARPDSTPKTKELLVLTSLSVAVYFSHLLGWLVFAIALALYAVGYALNRDRVNALRLGATALPSVVLLVIYALTRPNSTAPTIYYHHLIFSGQKAVSLIEPLMLFLRPDPFNTLIPVFSLNLIALLLLAGVAVTNLDRSRPPSRPMLLLWAALSGLALMIPLSDFRNINRPDERFVLPAFLLFIAAFKWKPMTTARALGVAAVLCAILAQHLEEDRHASRLSQQVSAATASAVPPDAIVLSITLWDGPIRGGCPSSRWAPSIGAPTLRWLDLRRLDQDDILRSSVLETSLIREKDATAKAGLTTRVMTLDEFRRQHDALNLSGSYSYVEVFGCSAAVKEAASMLQSDYAAVSSGRNFAALKNRSAIPSVLNAAN